MSRISADSSRYFRKIGVRRQPTLFKSIPVRSRASEKGTTPNRKIPYRRRQPPQRRFHRALADTGDMLLVGLQ